MRRDRRTSRKLVIQALAFMSPLAPAEPAEVDAAAAHQQSLTLRRSQALDYMAGFVGIEIAETLVGEVLDRFRELACQEKCARTGCRTLVSCLSLEVLERYWEREYGGGSV